MEHLFKQIQELTIEQAEKNWIYLKKNIKKPNWKISKRAKKFFPRSEKKENKTPFVEDLLKKLNHSSIKLLNKSIKSKEIIKKCIIIFKRNKKIT